MDIGTITTLLGGLGSLLGVGGTSVRWVHEGDRALVLRFGKARRDRAGQYRVLLPGWNWIIPAIDKANYTHVRQRTTSCGNQQVTLSDNTVFTVDAVLVWSVGDTPEALYRALFEVTSLEAAVKMYCVGVLREVIQGMDYKALTTSDADEIGGKLAEKVKARLATWGLVVESFKLADLSPYGDTLRLIQTEAATDFRVRSLKKAAEDLGYADATEMPASLSAALVGMPVSVAVTTEQP